jgi:uncharacterized protein YcbK (DUF882 family)
MPDLTSNLSRRKFLLAAGGLLLATTLPAAGKVDPEFWKRPRHLNLFRKETGEQFQAQYWADGRLLQQGYAEACWALRDVRSRKSVQMDVRLLDLLFGIQGYVAALRSQEHWLVITDGFRSPETNRAFREAGLPAARASRHLYGKAADLDVAGMSVADLGSIAAYFKGGGVGVYRDGHVHVDTGGIRAWRS